MMDFDRGDFDPLVSFIQAIVASYFMLKFYGPDSNKIFVDTVVLHVAEGLRTQTISFEVLTQHLQIDHIDERTHAYGMWPVSRSLPPLPVRSELFSMFLKCNKLVTKVDTVRLENA